jgi:hypothetical protein
VSSKAMTLSPHSRWQYLYTNILPIVAVNLVRCVQEADQSRRLAMAEVEKSAEAAAPLHVLDRALRRCRVLQKPVVGSLLLSLSVALKTITPRVRYMHPAGGAVQSAIALLVRLIRQS